MNEDAPLYIFDLDGTLTEKYSDEIYPDILAWFRREKPKFVAIATNQGGVGLRYWMESGGWGNPEQYPTETAVRERIHRIAHQIEEATGGQYRSYISFLYLSQKGNWSPVPPEHKDNPEWSVLWRKPGCGMLQQALIDFGADPEISLFVGDSPSDREAARAAGIEFVDAVEFRRRVVDG